MPMSTSVKVLFGGWKGSLAKQLEYRHNYEKVHIF